MAPKKSVATQKLVNSKLAEAMTLIRDAQALADADQIGFTFSIGDQVHKYNPKTPLDSKLQSALDKLTDEELEALGRSRDEFSEEPGSFDNDWQSSSC